MLISGFTGASDVAADGTDDVVVDVEAVGVQLKD